MNTKRETNAEKKMRQLVARFLKGETSNADEQRLYDYFSRDEVAESLKEYQEMFRWYAGLGGQAEGCKKLSLRRALNYWVISAAASLLLFLSVGYAIHDYRKQQEEYAMYEGSYIIRDGKKITDLRIILPELKEAERKVAELMQNGGRDENEVIPVI